MLRATLGAIVGGLLGAAIWTGVSYGLDVEIGWIAWGVGALAGVGAKLGAGEEASPTTGAIAALVSVAAILGARYATLSLYADQFLDENAETSDEDLADFSDELAISYVADEVVAARMEEGRVVAWPGGEPTEVPDSEDDYPADVWAEAAAVWTGLDAAERDGFKRDTLERERGMMRLARGEMVQQAFLESFSPIDLLFAFLAVATAFRVGSGTARVRET